MAGFVIRKNQRFRESAQVQYRGEGVFGEGRIKDLSLSGSHVAGEVPVSKGMTLALHVVLPGDSEPLLIERATVQWVKGSDFGVDLGAPQRRVAERITKIVAELVQKQYGALRHG